MTNLELTRTFAKSQDLLERAEGSDAWAANRIKNYSQIEGGYPFYASHAKGAYLWDVDGNRYIDYMLGYGTIVLGHADNRVTKAVVSEIENGACVSPLWKTAQIELNERLISVIPKAEMSFLMKTGSDATSGALRLARAFTGRDKVVRWGYNGWHDWATPRPVGVPQSIQSDTLKFVYNDIASLRAVFEAYPEEIACILMMPFEIEKPQPGFLHEVRALAHQHGALFILDEMRSGFRLSLGGAQEFFDIQADLATYSKALSNGYPVSAIVGRRDVLSGIGRTKMTSTFFGNSYEMAAALATITVLQETDAIKHIWAMGRLFEKGISELIDECDAPAVFHGYPPYPYIEFTLADEDRNRRIRNAFYIETARCGVLFHPNHHWYLSAAHTESDINETLDICRRGFEVISQMLTE